jgi:drug/metabolite transporter (DMT)-like permease
VAEVHPPERAARGTREETIGALLVGAASLLFGSVVILGKLMLRRGLPVTSMLAIRYAVAAMVLALTLAALRRPLMPALGERIAAPALGMCLYAVESALFFSALGHGTAAAVTLLFFTYPVFVTVVSWALGRGRPARLTILALASAVSGAGLVAGTGGGLAIQTAGVLFALASAGVYTSYLIGADFVLRKTNPMTSAMWVSAGAAVGLTAYTSLLGGGRLPSGWTEWWPVLGMGAATAGAFVCLMTGLQRLGAVRTSIVASTEPLATSLLALVFLSESVSLGTALGGVLILAGAIAASLAREATVQEQQIP